MTTIEQFRHYATILDSINEGVITVDSNMIITAINRAAAKITGYSREEAIGRRCCEIFRSTVCSLTCPVRDVMDSGEAASDIEVEILARNNTKVSVSFNAAVLYNELGKIVGAVKTFRDLSDLPQEFLTVSRKDGIAMRFKKCPPREMLAEILRRHHGNRTKVAKELGVERTTLWRWMNRSGLMENCR